MGILLLWRTGPVEAQTPGTAPIVPTSTNILGDKLATIGRTLDEKSREMGIPGFALVIVKGDSVIYKRTFGVRNLALNSPVTNHTMFAIGSATKAFTSMAVVMSQDEGLISLDSSPKRYLPYFRLRDPHADSLVTIRDLLSHRTGIVRADNIEGTGKLTTEEIIRILGSAEPTAPFRTRFQYNNSMFAAGGEALARANRTSWESVIRAKILRPLGMESTNATLRELRRSSDVATGYGYDAEKKITTELPRERLEAIAPAGAINSDATDMALWLRFLIAGGDWNGRRLVSTAGFHALVTKHATVNPNADYGLGWYLRDWNGHQVIEHGGYTTGFTSDVAFMPDQKLGFVLLTNEDNAPIIGPALETIWSNLVDTTATPVSTAGATGSQSPSVTTTALTADTSSPVDRTLIGEYHRIFNDAVWHIQEVNGGLVLANAGGQSSRLLKHTDGTYGIDGAVGSSVSVERDSAGAVRAFFTAQPYGDAEYDRVGAFTPSQTVSELMTKVVTAMGGAANIQKHHSVAVSSDVNYSTLGTTGKYLRLRRAPYLQSLWTTNVGLGKLLGTAHYFFNGLEGGAEGSYFPSRGDAESDIPDDRIQYDFYGLADWQKNFKKADIRNIRVINGEPCYVVMVSYEKATPEAIYVSTSSYRVVARELFGNGRTYFGDYRNVDGVMMPFSSTEVTPLGQRRVFRVGSVRFDVVIPDREFESAGARLVMPQSAEWLPKDE